MRDSDVVTRVQDILTGVRGEFNLHTTLLALDRFEEGQVYLCISCDKGANCNSWCAGLLEKIQEAIRVSIPEVVGVIIIRQ